MSAAPGPEPLARLGLLSIGMLLLLRCSDIWSKLTAATPYPVFFVLSIWLCLLGGLALMVLAFLSTRPNRLAPLLLVLTLFSQWVLHSAFVVTESYRRAPSDTAVLSLHAAVLDWLGVNPYGYNMADALSAYDGTGQSATPHLDGSKVEKLPYPPLHFLVLRPVLAWGLEGARLAYGLCFSLLVVAVFLYAPQRYRSIVLIPILVNPELLEFPLYWASDSVWALLFALMLWNWKRPLSRGILLGLACSYKQTPWLFAPYLAVSVFKQGAKPWRALGIFLGTSIGTFAAINLPYLARSPVAWFQGVFDPILSPYVPLGRGLSMLVQTNLLPLPRTYFSSLTLLVFITSVWFFYLDFERLRPLLWWFPALVLFFSYRSLPHYFIYSVPLLTMELSRYEFPVALRPGHRLRYLPLLTACLGAAFVTALNWPGPQTASARILVLKPNTQRASCIELEVTNNDSKAFQPSFLTRTNWRIFPWVIEKGPLTIEPGRTECYTIKTDFHYRTFAGHTDGQLIISDGIGAKGYRAVVNIPKQPSQSYSRGFDGPIGERWGHSGEVRFEGDTLHLSTSQDSKRAIVSRFMTLPFGKISLQLKRPDILPPETSFGIEIGDQQGKTLSVFLGESPAQGYYDPDHFYKVLPSMPGWNSYSLDPRKLYFESGFPLPSLERLVVQDVELIDRPVRLSFVLFSETPVSEAGVKMVHLTQGTTPGHRIADMWNSLPEYRAVLGDLEARRRRFDQALSLYEQAWPIRSPVRTTQEGSFLAIPRAHEFLSCLPLEEHRASPSPSKSNSETRASMSILAKPGLKLALKLEPPTSYSVRWDNKPWQTIAPTQEFPVPDCARIGQLSFVTHKPSRVIGIVATDES